MLYGYAVEQRVLPESPLSRVTLKLVHITSEPCNSVIPLLNIIHGISLRGSFIFLKIIGFRAYWLTFTMATSRVLKVPQSDDKEFVLLQISSSGKKPLDLKLVGTEGEAPYVVKSRSLPISQSV